MTDPLVVMTWDHPRGRRPVEACAALWMADHPDTRMVVQTRSLADFEHYPIQELAQRCDVVLYDHPFVGTAAQEGAFIPLDEWVEPNFLEDQRTHSVGPSYASYAWDGHQWGLAIDAAAQVAAFRPDLLENAGYRLPSDWEGLQQLGAHLPARTLAMALNPTHAFASFLTLYAALAADADWDGREPWDRVRGDEALGRIKWLWELAHPLSRRASPIDILERMSGSDEIWYVPLIFGYVNYAAAGHRPKRLRFGPLPAARGAVLGGVGIGVSALRTKNRRQALSFARYLVSAKIQGGPYVRNGGQPGHRLAWEDQEVNRELNRFFVDTLPALDGAYVRPRYAGYQTRQRCAELYLHDALTVKSSNRAILAGLDAVFSP